MQDRPTAAKAGLVQASDSPTENRSLREYGLSILKGAIGAIPHVGGLLNEILFEARSRLKQGRLESFVSEMAQALEKMREEQIDHEFLGSNEFSDLIEDVFLRVSRTNSHAKRQHFRNVLLKSITGARLPDFTGVFLNILEELSDVELMVYGKYYKQFLLRPERRAEGEAEEVDLIDYSVKEIMGLQPHMFKQVLQSLIRQGLLFDDSFGRFSVGPYEVIKSTELGASFYEWITSNEDS